MDANCMAASDYTQILQTYTQTYKCMSMYLCDKDSACALMCVGSAFVALTL